MKSRKSTHFKFSTRKFFSKITACLWNSGMHGHLDLCRSVQEEIGERFVRYNNAIYRWNLHQQSSILWILTIVLILASTTYSVTSKIDLVKCKKTLTSTPVLLYQNLCCSVGPCTTTPSDPFVIKSRYVGLVQFYHTFSRKNNVWYKSALGATNQIVVAGYRTSI